jgi:hypothetical protein
MEGEREPAEIKTLKHDLERVAAAMEQTGAWLAHAMEQSWQIAGALEPFPALADMLGERHGIIANDWPGDHDLGLRAGQAPAESRDTP